MGTHPATLSRFFSAGVFYELAQHGKSPIFANLLSDTQLPAEWDGSVTVRDVFEEAFRQLRKAGVRDEYVYRSALVQNVLLGTHSLKTASMLTEFRAVGSKADLVILNGTATVYEIKSDRDTLARLAKQVADYRKVFAKVFVIAGNEHVASVLETIPKEVGVLNLRRWNRISVVQEALDCSEVVDPLSILESLTTKEAAKVLETLEMSVPDLPNTQMRSALAAEFLRLEPSKAHEAMVHVLKQTRDLSRLSEVLGEIPNSLKAATLTYTKKSRRRGKLLEGLCTPLTVASRW